MRWRRESALDVYTGTFGLFLFVSPWLFAYANEAARIDVWASGAGDYGDIDRRNPRIFGLGGMAQSPAWVLVDDIAVGAGVHAHQGDAHQYWTWRDGRVRRGSGIMGRKL